MIVDMEVNLEKILNDCYDEYEDCWRNKDYYSALSILGEIFGSLSGLPKSLQMTWLARLRHIRIPLEVVEKVETDVRGALEHILRLLAIPSVLIYENIVFILVKRMEVNDIRNFLREFGPRNIEIDLDVVNEKIESELRKEETVKEYNLAIKSMKKHSRLPIESRWTY